MLPIFLMYALVASTFSFNKVLLESLPPIFLSGISTLIGGLILLSYLYWKYPERKVINKDTVMTLLPIAVCGAYGATMLKLYALAHLSSFKMTFFSALDPFITAVLCYYVKSERLSSKQLIGIIIATFGSVPMFINSSSDVLTSISLFSICAVVAATISNRYGWLLTHSVLEKQKYSVAEIIAVTMIMGGVLCLITSIFIEPFGFGDKITYSLMGMLLYVVVINNIVCSQAYTTLLKNYSITFLSLTEFLIPLFVAFYGWLFLNERITWHFFIATVLVGIGLFVFTYDLFVKGRAYKINRVRNVKLMIK